MWHCTSVNRGKFKRLFCFIRFSFLRISNKTRRSGSKSTFHCRNLKVSYVSCIYLHSSRRIEVVELQTNTFNISRTGQSSCDPCSRASFTCLATPITERVPPMQSHDWPHQSRHCLKLVLQNVLRPHQVGCFLCFPPNPQFIAYLRQGEKSSPPQIWVHVWGEFDPSAHTRAESEPILHDGHVS